MAAENSNTTNKMNISTSISKLYNNESKIDQPLSGFVRSKEVNTTVITQSDQPKKRSRWDN
jgi:hypothetical protein